jgi:glycosyltransferase involved in cell wall biosynthesis
MSKKIRVAYIGDSPFIYSGFGVVAKAILSRLPKDEFELHGLGTMYQNYPKSLEFFDYYQPACIHDLMGFKSTVDFVQHTNPDLLFFIGDPGTLRNRFSGLMLTGTISFMPAVTYFPIENAPLNPHIRTQAEMVASPVTYTKWGANELANFGVDVDWVWHGVDHGDFRKYDEDVCKKLKKLVGWEDKFVVGLVGMNKRSNRQPVMLEMAQILKDRGIEDFVVYMHCQTNGEIMMGGWELDWMLDVFGVRDVVQLKPNQNEHKYIARPRSGLLEESLELPMPKNQEEAQANLAALDFVSLLNCFDMYLDPASAHGFNLPACESARCGVPVATVDDGFARSEVYGDVAYMMKPTSSDYWHTGAMLPLVSPKTMADTVELFMNDSQLREDYAMRGKEKFDSVKWQPAADLFAQKMREAHELGVSATEKKLSEGLPASIVQKLSE